MEASRPEEGSGLRQRGAAEPSAAEKAEKAEAGKEQTPADLCPDKGVHRKNRNKTLCRRFLASPYYKFMILAIMSVTPVYGVSTALPKLLEVREVTSFLGQFLHYGFAIWASTMFIANFFLTQFTDPGNCKSVKPPRETTGQYELALGGDSIMLYAPSWCELCKNWKTPRSHHCSVCQRCVLRMDHHCPITGTCIGMRNQGHFILFYLFAFLGLSYSLASCISVVVTKHWQQTPDVVAAQEEALAWTRSLVGLPGIVVRAFLKLLASAGKEVALQTTFTGIACLVVFSCGCPALQLAMQNCTLLEMNFPMKEYVQLKPQVYCPLGPGFYQRRYRDNLQDLLGERWLWRLLLPIPGCVAITPALAPLPSALGAEALRQRLVQVEQEGVKQTVASCQELGFNPGPPPPASDGV